MIRCLDLVVATILLLLASPLLLLAAAVILASSGSPVLFRQERSGRFEQPFTMLKLRSMAASDDIIPSAASDAMRLTRVGRLLRMTSIDELPQLINVIVGDMSLVGPRPLLPHYAPYYRDRERLRFCVRPGLTGLAQVTGRTTIGWDEKLELDARFVELYSVRQYLLVLLRTPIALLHPAPETAWDHEVALDHERRAT